LFGSIVLSFVSGLIGRFVNSDTLTE